MSAKMLKEKRFNNSRIVSEPALNKISEFGRFNTILKATNAANLNNTDETLTIRPSSTLRNSDLGVDSLHDSNDNIPLDKNLSQLAGDIVETAVLLPRCLYCPFCAAEYMFEFTLKDHLKKKHGNEIAELARGEGINRNHQCPYCNAIFYRMPLIPLHLAKHHDPELLKRWQQIAENLAELNFERENGPSVEYVPCSPSMIDLFNSLDISGERKCISAPTTPGLKSILKKRKDYTSGKIIFSPSSASLRRAKGQLERRQQSSARRELRFDLPPMQMSPEDPLHKLRELNEAKKEQKGWKSIMKNKKKVKPQPSPKAAAAMVTSTPINFLDDDGIVPLKEKKKRWGFVFKKKVKFSPLKSKVLPSFYSLERFQCGLCGRKWDDNADLLDHLKNNHKNTKNFLKNRFSCGQCGIKFFKNKTLMEHCRNQHTPIKGM